jgi:hypothetical protein
MIDCLDTWAQKRRRIRSFVKTGRMPAIVAASDPLVIAIEPAVLLDVRG